MNIENITAEKWEEIDHFLFASSFVQALIHLLREVKQTKEGAFLHEAQDYLIERRGTLIKECPEKFDMFIRAHQESIQAIDRAFQEGAQRVIVFGAWKEKTTQEDHNPEVQIKLEAIPGTVTTVCSSAELWCFRHGELENSLNKLLNQLATERNVEILEFGNSARL